MAIKQPHGVLGVGLDLSPPEGELEDIYAVMESERYRQLKSKLSQLQYLKLRAKGHVINEYYEDLLTKDISKAYDKIYKEIKKLEKKDGRSRRTYEHWKCVLDNI